MIGQYSLNTRLSLVKNLQTAEDAPNYDDGSIPGDGLGAAGLDSSIFAHLKVMLASDWSGHVT